VPSVGDPTTEVQWEGAINTTVSDGMVEKTSGGGGFNAGATFFIPTAGDFSVEFQILGSDTFAGVSLHGSSGPGYGDIDYAFSVSGSSYYLYATGAPMASLGGYSPSDIQKMVRSNGEIRFYQNNTLIYTKPLLSSDPFSSGYMIFDCSISGIGSKVQNIILTYL